jgi:hypothetical protein
MRPAPSRLAGSALLLSILGAAGHAGSVAPAPPASGVYEMTGVTIDRRTGIQRPIHGTIVVRIEGARYTTHFELSTLFPGSQATAAQVTGTGDGRVEGDRLVGQAHTQLAVTSAPGVDVGFAYVPREVSPRILSRSTARFFADGSVRAEIENAAEEGSEYAPTKTTLVGYRRAEPEGRAAPR